MKKSELIKRLSNKVKHLKTTEAETIVNIILREISDALINGDRVELRGFGAFSIRNRKARKARNPKTGQVINLGQRAAIYFRPGKIMRESVNNS